MTSSKKTLLVLGLFAIAIVMFALSNAWTASANVYTLHAANCTGGWENPELATGLPASASSSEVYELNETNSAVLRPNHQAQIACGGFRGDILAVNAPKKINVRFSWSAVYPPQIPLTQSTSTKDGGEGGSAFSSSSAGGGDTSAESLIVLSATTTSVSTTTVSTDTVEIKNDIPATSTASTSDVTALPLPTSTPSETAPSAPTVPEVIPVQAPAPEIAPATEATPPAQVPAPSSEITPPVSFFDFFLKNAFAEELSSTTNTTTTVQVADPVTKADTTVSSSSVSTSSSEQATSTKTAESTYGIVEVMYTLDGTTWESLGFVEASEFPTKQFEIPLGQIAGWKDISKIQIAVRNASVIDGVNPTVYLDAVWLQVEYEEVAKDPHPTPATWRGDIFIGEAVYDTRAAVLVARPKDTSTIVLSDTALASSSVALTATSSDASTTPLLESATSSSGSLALESTSSATDTILLTGATLATTTGMTFELWLRDDTQSTTTPSWTLIEGEGQVNEQTKVYFRDGNIFWISNQTLWRFNPASHSYDSSSLSPDVPTSVYFHDEAGAMKVVLVSPVDGSVAFEDYVAPLEGIGN